MKTLCEETSLSGKFETITIMELRQRPGEVLQSVSLGKPPGETLTIAVDGKGRISYTK